MTGWLTAGAVVAAMFAGFLGGRAVEQRRTAAVERRAVADQTVALSMAQDASRDAAWRLAGWDGCELQRMAGR